MIPCEKSEMVAGYALGNLEENERELFERHLATCKACQEELRAYQRVVDELALSAPMVNPPPRLRAAILQKTTPQPSRLPADAAPAGSWFRRFFQNLSPAWGIASLALILALVFSNIYFIQQANQAQQAAGSPFHVSLLHSANQPVGNATAMVIVSEHGLFGTLVTDNLPPLNNQQQYQLWLNKDGKKTSGGIFSVNPSGYGWLKIESKTSLLEIQSFGVTIEPAGGSPAPTGQKVLGGNF